MDTTALTTTAGRAVGPLADLATAALGFIEASLSANTKRAYASDWKHFSAFCLKNDLSALPALPATVCLYVASLASGNGRPPCAAATIGRRLATITAAHESYQVTSPIHAPMVKTVMKGIRRTIGTKQNQKTPLLPDAIKSMIDHAPDTLKGKRDRALLLIGFFSALRRSELTELNVEDVSIDRAGLAIIVRKSKTDQEGEGRALVIPRRSSLCAVAALETYLASAGIESGALFQKVVAGHVTGRLPDYTIARIVKRYAGIIGLPSCNFSAHSMRSGFCTSAALAGASIFAIKRQTGHKSTAMVDRYIRQADLWKDNAVDKIPGI